MIGPGRGMIALVKEDKEGFYLSYLFDKSFTLLLQGKEHVVIGSDQKLNNGLFVQLHPMSKQKHRVSIGELCGARRSILSGVQITENIKKHIVGDIGDFDNFRSSLAHA